MTVQGFDPDRVARVTAALAVGERDPDCSLCGASAEVIGVSGAGVVLMPGGRLSASLCASNPVAAAVEDLQYTLGEGPCVDAFRSGLPILAPDLAGSTITSWPGFRAGALAAGVRAAFGFPLLVGRVGIGALNLYGDHPGPLSDAQLDDAAVVAHLVTRTVLGWQSGAPSGSLAHQLERVPVHLAVVHQAAGMVSVQAGVPVDDALVLLRAYAFAEDRPMSAVVAGVVDRLLRFDGEGTPRSR